MLMFLYFLHLVLQVTITDITNDDIFLNVYQTVLYITKSEHDSYDYQFKLTANHYMISASVMKKISQIVLHVANALVFSQCQTIYFVLALEFVNCNFSAQVNFYSTSMF